MASFEAIEHPSWERAFFGLFNRIIDCATPCVFASPLSLGQMPFELDDLRSRFQHCGAYAIAELSEAQRIELLQFRGQLRGMLLPEPVVQFIFKRCSRDLGDLMAVLDTLDRNSLAQQRRVTIPFVKDLLGL